MTFLWQFNSCILILRFYHNDIIRYLKYLIRSIVAIIGIF